MDIEGFLDFGFEYNREPHKFSSSAFIKINLFFRKVLTYTEIFSEGFKDRAIRGLLQICKIKCDEISQDSDVGG